MLRKTLVFAFILVALGVFGSWTGMSRALDTKPAADVERITYAELIDVIGRSRGKVVLLNFWASWCAPCRQEIPELKKLRQNVPPEDLVVIGITLDTPSKGLGRFVSSLDFNYPIYLGGQDVINAYSIMAIPRTIIYNPKGEKVFSHEGYMNKAMLMRAMDGFLPAKPGQDS